MTSVRIADRVIGPGEPCFVIAEAGVNHNGDLEMARALVDAAYACGADAVKFQTFVAEEIVSASVDKAEYQKRDRPGESQLDMLRRLQLPFEAFRELRDRATDHGLVFLSTPFDNESAGYLEQLEVPAYKIASGEVTNLPFLQSIGVRGRPVILSTGMSTLAEVRDAIAALTGAARAPVPLVLLHCVSNYPAEPADANLRAMETLASAFDVPVGYSDHTEGLVTAFAATALGACVIEKHLTLDRQLPGPDHLAALEPAGFQRLVTGIRTVQSALGDGVKRPAASEAAIAAVARRSLVLTRDAEAGTVLTEDLVAIRRPGWGIPPSEYRSVIGRKLTKRGHGGEPLTPDGLA